MEGKNLQNFAQLSVSHNYQLIIHYEYFKFFIDIYYTYLKVFIDICNNYKKKLSFTSSCWREYSGTLLSSDAMLSV